MDVKANAQDSSERVLASLTPETLDKLADLIVAKLKTANGGVLLPKQAHNVHSGYILVTAL